MTESLAHYFVTDIESDGPSPMANSMLSFATIVVRQDGIQCGEFEAVLAPRPDRVPDDRTMAFWRTQPKAWAAATAHPRPPAEVMRQFVDWVEDFDGPRSFAARPVVFDGIWIDHYLREFTDSFLLDVTGWGHNIFTAGALDIGSYISGLFNRAAPHRQHDIPAEWLGDHPHTHRAIDDARGYGALLSRLLTLATEQPPHPDDFIAGRLTSQH